MRPNIDDISSGESLKKWYWLKAELVAFCKKIGINYSGSKFEILDRIALSLDAEKVVLEEKKVKPSSKFDWSKETLTLDTLITDSYTNGLNTRTFFREYCGSKFSFNIAFMSWMKHNVGKTLRDAVEEWNRLFNQKIKILKRTFPKAINTTNICVIFLQIIRLKPLKKHGIFGS
jgi:hypothetical protein